MSSSSSAYSYKPGGSLKFKGGELSGEGKKKKKKSRSSTSEGTRRGNAIRSEAEMETDILQIERERKGDGVTPGESKLLDEEEELESIEKASGPTSNMTEAEKRFDMIRKKRLAERVAKQAKLSHKDRVDAFNRDLESRTEHFEMGRVGGGG